MVAANNVLTQEEFDAATTQEQRDALRAVYDRGPIMEGEHQLTFEEFRGKVHFGYDCIMVPWAGMWLGIEPDGYTHS